METLKQSLASTILVNIQYVSHECPYATADSSQRHGLVDLNRKVDSITTESVKWVDVKSFDDILRSHNLDTPQNEAKLLTFIEAHASHTKARHTSDDAETSFHEALDQGESKLEPWSAKSHHIIQSLRGALVFSGIYHRQESIHDNFEGTFQWIYEPPQDADRPWDSFATWLTEGRGIYWITGKAGSGKSTLMRMLHENKRTLELLRTWRNDLPLVTASFFFWNSGSDMQMSQDGLLRSILLQIIGQRLRQKDCDIFKERLVVFAVLQDPFRLSISRIYCSCSASLLKMPENPSNTFSYWMALMSSTGTSPNWSL